MFIGEEFKAAAEICPLRTYGTRDICLEKVSEHEQRQGVPEGSIFFSVDVVNLYGSIPLGEAVDAVRSKLEEQGGNIDIRHLWTLPR